MIQVMKPQYFLSIHQNIDLPTPVVSFHLPSKVTWINILRCQRALKHKFLVTYNTDMTKKLLIRNYLRFVCCCCKFWLCFVVTLPYVYCDCGEKRCENILSRLLLFKVTEILSSMKCWRRHGIKNYFTKVIFLDIYKLTDKFFSFSCTWTIQFYWLFIVVSFNQKGNHTL